MKYLLSLTRLVKRLPVPVIIGLAVWVSLHAAIGIVETGDRFCASCHVEPETTYYQDSLLDTPETLAASHAGKAHCIDCHSRQSFPGRVWAQWGGAQNLVAFYSGDYTSPGVTTRPVGDGGCTKCHRNVTWVTERPGHYHSPSLRRAWQRANDLKYTCVACHPAHAPGSFDEGWVMDKENVEKWCEDCHQLYSVTR